MKITAGELAELLNGVVVGDHKVAVDRPSRIEDGTPGSITFLANPKYERYAYTTRASILLVNDDFEPTEEMVPVLIKVPNVYESMAFLADRFEVHEQPAMGVAPEAWIHPEAEVDDTASISQFVVVRKGAKIGPGTILHPFVMVGDNVEIAEGCTIHAGVKIERSCIIGKNVTIHANTVIGSDGFGFAKTDAGYQKIKQLGNVVIEEDVEIGSNVVIDRSSLGSTIIGKGTKLDNLIQIAHGVTIGRHTVLAAQVGIAGSTKVGDHVMVGGQVGIIGHLNIADGSQIQAQSGVINSTKENDKIWGSPAMDYNRFLRSYAAFRNLSDMAQQLQETTRKLKELENKLDQLQSEA